MNLKICYGKTKIQLQVNPTRGMLRKRDKIRRLDNLIIKYIENNDNRRYAKKRVDDANSFKNS